MTTTFNTLISVDNLTKFYRCADWCVVDCRHDLSNPDFGLCAYRDGHIVGAVFLSLDRDLSGPLTGSNGRHPLPDASQLAQRLGQSGISNQTQVIAYDDAGGMYAARLWWLLRWLGHARVAVLDGGLRAWQQADLPLERQAPEREPTVFEGVPQNTTALDAETLWNELQHTKACLMDARSPDRFRGENESLDPVGGHIPGAVNRFFRDNLDDHGRFLPADTLRKTFTRLIGDFPPQAVVHQCGSGVTACLNLLAMEHAGLTGSRLYPGSWSEWCTDPARPVVTGASG